MMHILSLYIWGGGGLSRRYEETIDPKIVDFLYCLYDIAVSTISHKFHENRFARIPGIRTFVKV